MRPITILNPPKLVFGNGALKTFFEDLEELPHQRLFIITTKHAKEEIKTKKEHLIDCSITSEPSIEHFESLKKKADKFSADAIIAIGGGSVLDVAKLVAAKLHSSRSIHEDFGIGNLPPRKTYLACLPTTAGTGSEVSPNAILVDGVLKKGVISPHLVPDATYIDPLLTHTVPPDVTAATAMDALTHCMEAYTNKFSHPIIDAYALEGIRLIFSSLERAYKNGKDTQARENIALGSFYGGICLGPVNTAAVHALSYPLGGEYHIPHGVSNALLLPYVMRFNYMAAPERYAAVARSLGSTVTGSEKNVAEDGVRLIFEMMQTLQLPLRLSEIAIPKEAIPSLAEKAMTVQRLLKNNPREVTREDAIKIYQEAY